MMDIGRKGRPGLVVFAAAALAVGMGIESHFDIYRPKRRKTGATYPHSSKRQRARYARQIAAGQLSMAGIA